MPGSLAQIRTQGLQNRLPSLNNLPLDDATSASSTQNHERRSIMTQPLRTCAAIALAVALSGCVSVPRPAVRADGTWCFQSAKKRLCTSSPVPSETMESAAKAFLPAPNRHVVWIVRNDWWDADGRVAVRVGSTLLETLPRTVSRVELPGGAVQLSLVKSQSHGEQTIALTPSMQSFVTVEYQWGLFRTNFRLVEVDANVGKALANKSKLINDRKVP